MTSPLPRPSLPALPLLAGFLFAISAPFADPAESEAPDPFSGTYQVVGTTVDLKSGDTRRIDGHIVLSLKNGRYQAVSELSTELPTQGGAVHTDVIGTGEGDRKGDTLSGTAHTQLVIQAVPGVDTNFAFIPRQVGPRLVSSWKAHLEADGTLLIELSNKGEKGERYRPTTTTLHGKRVPMPQQQPKTP